MSNQEPELADGSSSSNEWYDADKENQSDEEDSRLFHNQLPVLKSA